MTDPKSADSEDFSGGVPVSALADGGMVQGKLGQDEIVIVRRGAEFFAIGANCTHYGGPLAQGLVVGEEIRCPLHHACFSLRTGEALRAPAFDSIPCWRVERIGDRVVVRERLVVPGKAHSAAAVAADQAPSSVVIIGAGAAAFAAADTLRKAGFEGSLTLISADEFAPYDRPNLSKDYLAGTASPDWIPLRPPEYYADKRIDVLLSSRVISLATRQRLVQVEGGKTYNYDRLLLATGADPVRLTIDGASNSQLLSLRTFTDSSALAAAAGSAKRVVIVGGSFIGLEVAASLRARDIEVQVVTLEKQPLARVMGLEVGRFIRTLHESHGVRFHLEDTVVRLEGSRAVLKSGAVLDADLVVLGVGVRPSLTLAEQAGLQVDRGVVVDEYLETSAPGVFAAGDIARWPDARSGQRIRVEHWVVAERQGQVAARNMLGRREKFAAVPFFWTQQYDVAIKYVGHAESWDDVEFTGNLDARDCAVAYKQAGRTLAVATISRDLYSLRIEAEMEGGRSLADRPP